MQLKQDFENLRAVAPYIILTESLRSNLDRSSSLFRKCGAIKASSSIGCMLSALSMELAIPRFCEGVRLSEPKSPSRIDTTEGISLRFTIGPAEARSPKTP